MDICGTEKIAVAMSGGVDSSTTALLLARAGHRVVGITMQLSPPEFSGADPADEARRSADLIGIPHHVVDLHHEFTSRIVHPFAAAYCSGLTPNPCARCNVSVKFGLLAEQAAKLGCPMLATGHYVQKVSDGRAGWRLLKGIDPSKDQSYFLFGLGQEQLGRACFPLGRMTKSEVRGVAEQSGLPPSRNEESQDICFLSHYGDESVPALAERLAHPPGPGEIVDREGNRLGTHPGIHHFTVGQRRGLDLPSTRPWYVLRLEPQTDRVVVGREEDLYLTQLTLSGMNWIPDPPPTLPLQATVRIRYRHPGAPALISAGPDGLTEVCFEKPQRAVTPGQAAVLYHEEEVLGGGWINLSLLLS
jgi:tRNA-specific 2-thiouridylase